MLQNRGNAHQSNGDLAAAIADYDAAVAIGEGIRDALRADGEAAWSLPLRNDLAAVLQNRGLAHWNNGDLAAAIADYDAAVAIGEGIRDALRADGEAAWSLTLRNDLAAVLQNRGNAHADNGDLAAAIADYDAAVAIGEGIRDALRADGEAAWSLPLRNDLARVLQNRGLAHWNNGDLAAAIADYDAAVAIGEGIRDALRADGEAAWSAPLRVDLARIHANRAMALGPTRGAADLAAIRQIAAGLRALGNARLAGEVDGFSQGVQQHWLQSGGLAEIRRQHPVGFWIGLVLTLVLAPVLIPVGVLLWLLRKARQGRRGGG